MRYQKKDKIGDDGSTTQVFKAILERRTGISPFWNSTFGRRPPFRLGNETDNYWRNKIWPRNGESANERTLDAIQENIKNWTPKDDGYIPIQDFAFYDHSKALSYCLLRGLCAKRPPHHEKNKTDQDNDEMHYNTPSIHFPLTDMFKTKLSDFGEMTTSEVEFEDVNLGISSLRNFPFRYANDLVRPDTELTDKAKQENNDFYIEPAQFCRWTPVRENFQGQRCTAGSPYNEHKAVCECVVYESMIDMFASMKETFKDTSKKQHLVRAAIAAAKLKQLPYMKKVFSAEKSRLPEARVIGVGEKISGLVKENGSTQTYFFLTRPVAVCFENDDIYPPSESRFGHFVLYPCDAGIAQFSTGIDLETIDKYDEELVDTSRFTIRDFQMNAVFKRIQMKNTSGLRLTLGVSDEPIPLYIANPPTFDNVDTKSFERDVVINPKLNKKDPRLFCEDVDHARVIRYGIHLANTMKSMQTELNRISELKKRNVSKDSQSVVKKRREVVWNDALREAAISGDRLYAFLRQLSGVINETLDSVCLIDDGMLVQQQNKLRERRNRISERAAQEHINLVRGVFAAVLRESGLTLGIGNKTSAGEIGELKVVSNNLRKQVSELAQGQGTEGFFGNSVRMEQLLASGTGELTLVELFSKLQDVGKALQNAVAAATSEDQPYNGASMDFLSAPRNSMMLRYKPEALAAIKQAFEIFQREFTHRTGVMVTPISAFELMEGNDDTLTTHFATFCAHMLVHSRMFGSSTAMYVGQFPSVANAQQLKISLERLCRAAHAYRMTSPRPMFLDDGGRERYFAAAVSRQTKMFF